MSSALISVNFQNLKYNLYEILGVDNNSSEKKIKKNYLKLAKELHPDKNPDYNEELWDHISIAHQVLTNSNLKQKYNEFLDDAEKKESFLDLKNTFEYEAKEVEKLFPVKDEAKKTFKSKIEELNKKHGFMGNSEDTNVMSQYSKIKQSRSNQINIPQEKIGSTDDFNNLFEKRKENDQLITISQTNSTLLPYQYNDGLSNINDYSALYLEDSISTGGFTSLDMAFRVQKLNTNFTEKTLEEKLKEYKNVTSNLGSRKPSDYSSKKFDEWTDN